MAEAKTPINPWLDVPEIDPDCTLTELSKWILECLRVRDKNFDKHGKWSAFYDSALAIAVDMAFVEGHYLGATYALIPFAEIDAVMNRIVVRRMAEQNLMYERHRAKWIDCVAQKLLDATLMFEEVPHGGAPKKLLPDYDFSETLPAKEPLKKLRAAIDFALAVELVSRKNETGRMFGVDELIQKKYPPSLLSDNGDEAQRIKRIARRIVENENLYLAPTICALRARAAERVKKAEDFLNS